MVLGPRGPGRVGRRRVNYERAVLRGGSFAFGGGPRGTWGTAPMAARPHGPRLIRMSTLGIVLIAIAAVLLLLLIGGFAGAARRRDRHASHYERNLAEADRAL